MKLHLRHCQLTSRHCKLGLCHCRLTSRHCKLHLWHCKLTLGHCKLPPWHCKPHQPQRKRRTCRFNCPTRAETPKDLDSRLVAPRCALYGTRMWCPQCVGQAPNLPRNREPIQALGARGGGWVGAVPPASCRLFTRALGRDRAGKMPAVQRESARKDATPSVSSPVQACKRPASERQGVATPCLRVHRQLKRLAICPGHGRHGSARLQDNPGHFISQQPLFISHGDITSDRLHLG